MTCGCRLWRRIISDAFQLPLRFPTEPESAALGAALQAAAVHSGENVADYVESHAPPLADEVRSVPPSAGRLDCANCCEHGSPQRFSRCALFVAWDVLSMLDACGPALTSCVLLQTMDPIAENASAYEDAFNRHQELGTSLFAS